MAEVNQASEAGVKKQGRKKVRSKKASTKIDMTPMVDLAFLLLTFFMLTTTFTKPQTMQIEMPAKPQKEEDIPVVNEKRVLTLVLGEADKVYWFVGITDPKVARTDFSREGIRKIVVQHNARIKNMIVLIKTSKNSRYKNLVDIFDEMNICNIARFALVDITPEDEELIKNANL